MQSVKSKRVRQKRITSHDSRGKDKVATAKLFFVGLAGPNGKRKKTARQGRSKRQTGGGAKKGEGSRKLWQRNGHEKKGRQSNNQGAKTRKHEEPDGEHQAASNGKQGKSRGKENQEKITPWENGPPSGKPDSVVYGNKKPAKGQKAWDPPGETWYAKKKKTGKKTKISYHAMSRPQKGKKNRWLKRERANGADKPKPKGQDLLVAEENKKKSRKRQKKRGVGEKPKTPHRKQKVL